MANSNMVTADYPDGNQSFDPFRAELGLAQLTLLKGQLPSNPTLTRPKRAAIFSDSRGNFSTGGSAVEVGFSGVTAVAKANNRAPIFIEMGLTDFEAAYNFGVSGAQFSTGADAWDSSTRTAGKTAAALQAYAPDFVWVQGLINDYINGVSAATATASMKNFLMFCMGIGAKIIYSHTQVCSLANYGGGPAAKLAATLAGNAIMKTFCSGFPGRIFQYDLNPSIVDSTGYLSSTYSTDGTHFTPDGGLLEGLAARSAILQDTTQVYPLANAIEYSSGDRNAPNLIRWGLPGPSMFSANEVGTYTVNSSWNIDPNGGPPWAQFDCVCLTLAGGFARTRLEIHSDTVSGATALTPLFIGDKLQAYGYVTIDDGAGGLAAHQSISGRHRLYSDTKFGDSGGFLNAVGTNLLRNYNGPIFLPPFITATASVGISAAAVGAGYPLQIFVENNTIGQKFTVKVFAPAERVVNPVQMPSVITVGGSPFTYTNNTGRNQDIVYDLNGATVSALTWGRSGAVPVSLGPLSAGLIIPTKHGDTVTATFSVGTPKMTAFPGGFLDKV